MRWRATVLWPEKRGDTMVRRQCVWPPGRAPAWPACCADSSTRSSWTGSSAASRSRMLAATFILVLHVPGEHQGLRQDKEQHQTHAAEELEVDPVVGGEVVGDVEVERAHEYEETDPAPVEPRPHGV